MRRVTPRFRVFRSVDEVPADFGPSALTIGNFDGLHAGHQRVLFRLREIAEKRGWKASVLTFDPHPAKIVAPERAPRLMTSPDERCELLRRAGIEQVLILPFSHAVAQWTPEEFAGKLISAKLGAKAVVIGENFRFGHNRAGDTGVLDALGRRLGFFTEVVNGVCWRGVRVSSSAVRRMVMAGAVARAARLLQRPYALEGDVVRGHGVGAKRTVPTLNLATRCEVLPARGVYITRTTDLSADRQWESVTNVGFRPTFGGDEELSIETFLLSKFDGDTPRRIRVEFLERLREERKFSTPEALRTQIMRDVARTQSYFRRIRKWARQPVFDYTKGETREIVRS